MPLYSLEGRRPQLPPVGHYWIAPDASLIGDVRVGRDVGIWFGAVVRGDNEPIVIGARTNVQEHSTLHTDMGYPLDIGEDCTIGHNAILHGCAIGDGSLIGMGAVVLNGAKIGRGCLVGARALVTEDKVFPDHSLIIGARRPRRSAPLTRPRPRPCSAPPSTMSKNGAASLPNSGGSTDSRHKSYGPVRGS